MQFEPEEEREDQRAPQEEEEGIAERVVVTESQSGDWGSASESTSGQAAAKEAAAEAAHIRPVTLRTAG